MARPRSEEKRNAILAAAIDLIAERSLAATPTSQISRRAGVAEGTLFTYFKTKEDLVNVLYRDIKLEMADWILAGFPRKGTVRQRLEHIWGGQITWGILNPKSRKALRQLQVSGLINAEAIDEGSSPFEEIYRVASDAVDQRLISPGLCFEFAGHMMGAMAAATIEFIESSPCEVEKYRTQGFEMFWASITRK